MAGKITSCVATTLADEGLDVRRLSSVIIAGGGKSVTRIYQRIGRGLRSFTDPVTGAKKDKAIIIVFHHKCKFLDKHGKVIRNLLKKEPAFVLRETTPDRVCKDVLATITGKETLTELEEE